jgi:aminoglycoside phosphotransferase (APT) family kinase protein
VSELSTQDLAAVGAFLVGVDVPVAGPLRSTLIAGGRSNLTFRVEDGQSRWVLRMPPRAGRTPSAHDVAREYRVTSALQPTDVPVPPAVALCEDTSVIGCPFAIAEFVAGRTVQSRADLDILDDATVESVSLRLVQTLAALHRVDPAAVGLERFARPDAYAKRQVNRWLKQWQLVATADILALGVEVGSRLEATIPDQKSTGIVHGDFRIDNTLLELDDNRAPRITAVVDWELSTLGDPVADVAMMCAYRHPAFDLIVGAPAAWTSDRLARPTELAEAYEAAGGVPLAAWEFHLALAYFKIGVIAAGIEHRVCAGVTAGPGFDTAGASIVPYLELARKTLETQP